MSQRTVAVNFVANTAQYTAGVGRAAAATGSLQGAASMLTRGLLGPGALVFALTQTVRVMNEAEEVGRTFANEMTKLQTQIGLTKDETDEMAQAALTLGGATTKGPQELAEAMFFIASAGLRGSAAMDVLRSSAQLSAIGMGETKVIADLLTSAVNAFGEESISAAEAADDLVSAVRLGKLEADQMAGAMGRLMPIAAAMGTTFNDVSGMMAAMSRTGTDAATASTQLRAIMVSLLRPTQQSEQAMAKYNLSQSELLRIVEEDGLFAALLHINQAVDGQATALAELFPNQRAYIGVLDLMGPGLRENIALMEEHTGAAGTAAAAFAEFSQTGQASLDRLTAAQERLRIEQGLAQTGVRAYVRNQRAAFAENRADTLAFRRDADLMTRTIVDETAPALALFADRNIDSAEAMKAAREESETFNTAMKSVDDQAKRLARSGSDLGVEIQTLQLDMLMAGASADEMTLAYARLLSKLAETEDEVPLDEWADFGHLLGVSEARTVGVSERQGALARALGLTNEELAVQIRSVRELHDAQLELLDPIFRLVSQMGRYEDASARVAEMQANGETGTREYVEALFEQERAFLELQGTLAESELSVDSFVEHLNGMLEAGRLNEDQVRDIIRRLGEQDIAMGMLDGKVVRTRHVHTIETRFTGDVAAPRGVGGVDFGMFEARARGGPVMPGRAYLVGEEGPELIVPQGAGHVMTAGQTAGMLGGSTYNVNVHMPPGADGEQVVSALRRWERSNGPIPVGVR